MSYANRHTTFCHTAYSFPFVYFSHTFLFSDLYFHKQHNLQQIQGLITQDNSTKWGEGVNVLLPSYFTN